MKEMFKKFFCLVFVLFFVSCGSRGLKEREEFRGFLRKGEFQKAEDYIKKSKFYQDEDNQLLLNLE
ncbi:MAG: hypothetical protein ACPGJV_15960, partial [Bacteriovoracaceae bacterium]